MKRNGRVHITFKGHAQDSWAELELPVEEVVSGLTSFVGTSLPASFEIEGLFADGSGCRVTLERTAKKPGP